MGAHALLHVGALSALPLRNLIFLIVVVALVQVQVRQLLGRGCSLLLHMLDPLKLLVELLG